MKNYKAEKIMSTLALEARLVEDGMIIEIIPQPEFSRYTSLIISQMIYKTQLL